MSNDIYAFVLVSSAPGKEHETYNALMKKKRTLEIHPLFEDYDLMLKINGKDFNDIDKYVTDEIRTADGVIDTKTLVGSMDILKKHIKPKNRFRKLAWS